MCFSAGASFLAATVLGGAGAFALGSAKGRMIPFAATPLLFSFQQAAEGLVWVAAQSGQLESHAAQVAIWIFLLMAFSVWPIWIPLVLMVAEPNRKHRKVFLIPLLTGVVLFVVNVWTTDFASLSARIVSCSLQYDAPMTNLNYLLYPIATLTPFFMSTIRAVPLIGVLITVGAVVAAWFYWATFTSVWCFFAAMVSVAILYVVHRHSMSCVDSHD
jgi:hypothetical protein